MSFQNQSGELMPFTEVVPASAQFGAPERSSILTSRRRMRISPQTQQNVGTAGAGAAGQQIQFLIADQGGMLDLRSVVLNYTIQVSGASTPCADDGHPFSTLQVNLNGQLLENIQNAAKLCNVEVALGGSKTYYETAGSLQGFELLNPDLDTAFTAPTATTLVAGSLNSYGFVAGNQGPIATRHARASAAVFNNIAGEQRSIPLGMMCGLGRMATYLPISLLGELGILLQTGSAAEMLFSTSATAGADYSLSNLSIEYDIVTPDQRYFSVLQKIAMEDGAGLVMPYESSIVTTSASVGASASPTENSLVVSRATSNLLRSSVVFVPTIAVSQLGYPSQSCFGHAGLISAQWRIGSLVYPSVACTGDAALFNMSMSAYGSVMQENGTIINRVLWGNSTNPTTAGTAAVFETAEAATGGQVKFAYADKCIASYGFQTIKGGSEALAVDGVNVAGASGAQVILSIVQAPGIAYQPYVILTALKFIVAKQGGVSVVGA